MMKMWLMIAGLISTGVPAALALTGAGATFPNPIYSKWIHRFQELQPSAQINYQATGSGAGIQQFIQRIVDFAASDAPMTNDQIAKVKEGVLHVPTVIGAVVLAYNLPELKEPLRLTPDLIVDLYLGRTKKWSDPKLKAENPNAAFPASDVRLITRSDGSGTTAVFADYLSKVSPEWAAKVKSGTTVQWPARGLAGKGNDGVTAMVRQNVGSIGYVEHIYAEMNSIPFALIQNQAKNFVRASIDSVSEAAASTTVPPDFRVSITNAPGPKAYPIAAFTYLLVYKEMPKEKGKALLDFIGWALGPDGQALATDMKYAQLPIPLRERALGALNEVKLK